MASSACLKGRLSEIGDLNAFQVAHHHDLGPIHAFVDYTTSINNRVVGLVVRSRAGADFPRKESRESLRC